MVKAVRIGIDFGTSNCAAAVLVDGAPYQIPLEGDETLLPSVLYVDRAEPRSVRIRSEDLEREVERLRREQSAEARQAKAVGRRFVSLPESDLVDRARAALSRLARREQELGESTRSMASQLLGANALFIGRQAVRARMDKPLDGLYFKSPKRFLGSDLQPEQRVLFKNVIATMLNSIREACEASISKDRALTSVVLGRPVRYSLDGDADSERQALEIMSAAAADAGFTDVGYLMEPIAAAVEFERHLSAETVALIIDAGGGTTDCTVVRLDPRRKRALDRSGDVLSTTGCRSGGVDIDEALAWRAFMSHLGRDEQTTEGRPLPYTLFHDAISAHDIRAQERFYRSEGKIEQLQASVGAESALGRLRTLCVERYADRLVRSSELAKIALSEEETIRVPLQYLEQGLTVSVSRSVLMTAAEAVIERIVRASKEAISAAGTSPDVIYVTGGTAKSPVVRAAIEGGLGLKCPILVGDMFGSVVSGLAIHGAA